MSGTTALPAGTTPGPVSAKPARPVIALTGPQKAVAALVALLALTLAALSFLGMFKPVRDEMVPFFHGLAWIVPLGVDVGIMALNAASLLLEWLGMPMPALRWVAQVFMGASVYLNVSAAGGHWTGIVGHAALPVLFITCMEAARHAVRRAVGMASGTVRDGIPLARWLLAPVPSFLMFRRMVLQRIHSYPQAVDIELARRRARASLRVKFGPQWKREAPGDVVWMLRKGIGVPEACDRVREIIRPVPSGTAPAAMVPPAVVPAKGSAKVPVRQGSVPDGSAQGSSGSGSSGSGGSGSAKPRGSGSASKPVPVTAGSRQMRTLDTLVREGRAAETAAGRRLGAKAIRQALSCNYQTARAVAKALHPEEAAGQDDETKAVNQ